MLMIFVAILAAAVLLAGSAWIIWRYDPPRIWDHFARTLVQAAIAMVSVLVAFVLFEQQFAQQDTRLKLQQARSTVATLRSIMVSAAEQSRDIPLLYIFVTPSYCGPKTKCGDDFDYNARKVQKEWLGGLVTNPQASIIVLKDVRAAVSELIKNNYNFSDRMIRLMFSAVERYEQGARDIATKFDELREQHNQASMGGRELSPETIESLYGGFAYQQARSSQVVLTFICRLDKINKLLLTSTEPETDEFSSRYSPIDIGTSCPPYGAPFEVLVKWIEDRK
jgi:hypothetical protein